MRRAILNYYRAILAILLIVGLPAFGMGSQPYAVVIGIDQYSDPIIQSRPHAEADAKALYDLLSDPRYYTGDTSRVHLLLGKPDPKRPSRAATRDNIRQALEATLGRAGEDDPVVICWFGQGGPVGDRTGYFTRDTVFKDKKFQNLVAAVELEEAIEKTKSQRLVVLIDVNFRGYDADKAGISERGLEKVFQEFDGRADRSDALPRQMAVLSANDGRRPSIELKDHGLFATVVLEALRGKADTEGGEADGLVHVDELFKYVNREVPRRSAGMTRKPQIPSSVRWHSQFAVTRNPKAYAVAQQRLTKFAELVKRHGLSDEIAEEGRDLLAEMPRWQAQRNLRKAYQQFVDGKLAVDDFLAKRDSYLSSLKVSRREAEAFAEKILKIAGLARDHYVRPVKLDELVAEAIKGLYRAVNEKLPDELAERVKNVAQLDRRGLRELLIDVRQELGSRDDLKGPKASDIALNRMLHSLDPHSTYIDAEKVAEFERLTKQEFIGVGIQIQKDFASDMIRVVTPLRGGPAHRAGIKQPEGIAARSRGFRREDSQNRRTRPRSLRSPGQTGRTRCRGHQRVVSGGQREAAG